MEELKKFTGQAMNLDKNDKSLLPTETREVYNSITDRKGVFTRIEGNTLVNFTLPAGDNKVIGWCNDYSRHAIIYFVKNSLGNHCILRVRGNKIDKVLWVQPVLNFKGRINHANVIGDLLYWTDGHFESSTDYNPPRKINMIRAIGGNYTFLSTFTYEKHDVVYWDGKVYEFIGDTPGVFPLSDTDNWQLKGRVYDNLTSERLYWILDRIKYPNHAQAPEVYYSDNVPATDPPVIIDPPTTIPYGFLYNWDALFDVVPDPDGLELTFDDIANVPVADASSVSDWNTFFDLPTNGSPFTSVIVDGDKVSLFGGSGITLIELLFSENTNLLKVEDYSGIVTNAEADAFYLCNECLLFAMYGLINAGEEVFYSCKKASFDLPALAFADNLCFYDCIAEDEFSFPNLIECGNYCFNQTEISVTETINLPLLTTAGESAFSNTNSFKHILVPNLIYFDITLIAGCTELETLDISSCENLGATTGDDNVFNDVSGQTITITVPAALMTCNGGNPDGDIQTLQAANTVTIVTV